MPPPSEDRGEEVRRLQGCINGLMSVIALPALWSGRDSSVIVGTLLDGVLGMLRLDFAYAKLRNVTDGSPDEMARVAAWLDAAGVPAVRQSVATWLTLDTVEAHRVIRNPCGEGNLSVELLRLFDVGVLVAASQRVDFPTQTEMLLLRVAANQAAIGLQDARRSDEQKRTAKDLEDELTAELKAMTALHEFSTRLLASTDLQRLLEQILDAIIALQNADFGNVQLYNREIRTLEIVAQRGFQQDFLDHFRRVDDTAACGRAILRGQRIIIEDVEVDPAFEPHRSIATAAGFRAVQSTPLFSRTGEPLGMLSTHFRRPHRPSVPELRLTDLYVRQGAEMIELKRAEESLRATQSELARISRVTTVGELTASIAHEVNQPLAAIVIGGQACARWLASEPPNLDEARKTLDRIIDAGTRASDVLARIRALVKKTGTEKEPVDMNEVVHDVVAITRGELRKNEVACRTEMDRELPCVIADRVQLQQVLLNLIMNAIEAMSAIGGQSSRELIITTRRDASQQVRVAVCDSGVGIDPQGLEQVFEAFYTTKESGMGIGLSISRSIVETHGGRLWAERNDGPGATFVFTLPIADPS